jgi:hypothetical protein
MGSFEDMDADANAAPLAISVEGRTRHVLLAFTLTLSDRMFS